MRHKSKTGGTRPERATRGATVRLPDELHHRLSVKLRENRDTFLAFVVRSANRYLDEQEGKNTERDQFLATAQTFWRVASPDVRALVQSTMKVQIDALVK